MCLIELNKLLIEYQKGKDCLEDIYNLSYKKIFAYLLSLSRNYHLAEDLAQETYVALARSIKNYEDKNASLTYLISISKNLYLNYLRKNKHSEYVEELFLEGDKNLESEDELLIRTILNKLNESEREIVYLFVIKELKHKDIARITKKPLGTVTWYYNQAMKKLRKAMEEENEA